MVKRFNPAALCYGKMIPRTFIICQRFLGLWASFQAILSNYQAGFVVMAFGH
jgi:hypothetical protein